MVVNKMNRGGGGGPSRRDQGRGHHHHKKKKTQSVKNQIRNLERLLQNKSLPEEVQEDMRAKLADLQGKREEHQRQDKERAFAVKYRKVKFFETRKIIRKLRTIQRQIKEAGDDAKKRKKLEKDKDRWMSDLQYVLYYPKTYKYIALFAGEHNNGQQDDPKTRQRREEMRKLAAAAAQTAEDEGKAKDLEEMVRTWGKQGADGAGTKKTATTPIPSATGVKRPVSSLGEGGLPKAKRRVDQGRDEESEGEDEGSEEMVASEEDDDEQEGEPDQEGSDESSSSPSGESSEEGEVEDQMTAHQPPPLEDDTAVIEEDEEDDFFLETAKSSSGAEGAKPIAPLKIGTGQSHHQPSRGRGGGRPGGRGRGRGRGRGSGQGFGGRGGFGARAGGRGRFGDRMFSHGSNRARGNGRGHQHRYDHSSNYTK